MRKYIISNIHRLRRCRQKGLVIQFSDRRFDPDIMDFVKIGKGSLGGKARGLAFISNLLHQTPEIQRRYPGVNIVVPRTMVIATDGFEAFVAGNELDLSRICDCPDEEIRERFLSGRFPDGLAGELAAFLRKVTGPLSIRSSSLLEDAHVQSTAGLYKTYMIPNNHDDFFVRLAHLMTAVKLVYASTFFERPLTFARSISKQFQEDSMAVIVQQLAGSGHGDFFYPGRLGDGPVPELLSPGRHDARGRDRAHRAGPGDDHRRGRGDPAVFPEVPDDDAPVLDGGRHPGQRPAVFLRLEGQKRSGAAGSDPGNHHRTAGCRCRGRGVSGQEPCQHLRPRGEQDSRQRLHARPQGADLRPDPQTQDFSPSGDPDRSPRTGAKGHGRSGGDRVLGRPERNRAAHLLLSPATPPCHRARNFRM